MSDDREDSARRYDDSAERSDGVDPGGRPVDGWPVRLAGVTETVIATRGPEGRWNQAALGVAPPGRASDAIDAGETAPASASTYGRTRTRRNLAADGPAYVQFTEDPLDFVEAALGIYETEEPTLASADAWTRVTAEELDRTDERGTEVVEWSIAPVESGVRERAVPTTTNRGRGAVIEATVWASRIGVEGYDEADLVQRLQWLADVVETAGGDRSRVAFERIDEHVGWRDRLE